MNKTPPTLLKKYVRDKEYFIVYADITGQTYKPFGAKKEHYAGGKYLAQIELPISRLWDILGEYDCYATIPDAKSGILLPRHQ
jgi:hypothetical protein